MWKSLMYPVKKIPFDGPGSFQSIIVRMEEDAKNEGMERIDLNAIKMILKYAFSVRGVLSNVPHFVTTSIPYFGRWVPDRKLCLLRKEYYVEKKKFGIAFRKKLSSIHEMLKRSKNSYRNYYLNSSAEIKLSYKAWEIATGRKRKISKAYRELNKLRSKFTKLEKEKYHYIRKKCKRPKKKRRKKTAENLSVFRLLT